MTHALILVIGVLAAVPHAGAMRPSTAAVEPGEEA
jgi:hypothetical protein